MNHTPAILVILLLMVGAVDADDLAYRLPRPLKVSIHIRDAAGQVVRELAHAVERTAGAQVEQWDRCDDAGRPVPAGTYTWKLLATPGLAAEYLMSLGADHPVGEDDWRARSPGTHGGPSTVLVDGDHLFVGASITEHIENMLVKNTLDGTRRRWSAWNHVPWKGGVSSALAGGVYLMLATDGNVWRYDAATGRHLEDFATAWDKAEKIPVPVNEQPLWPMDMDCDGRLIAVTYRRHDAIRWFDAVTGRQVHEIGGVPAPTGIACAADGTWLVASGDGILRGAAGQRPTPWIAGLKEPVRLTVERGSGDVLVVEWGTHQIRRHAADGALRRTYGRAGGRRDGLYTREEQECFDRVHDIACDGHGGFVVCEPWAPPRRTVRLDRDGHLVREWYGGQVWGPWVATEPDDPSAVWMASSWDGCMRLAVDYAARTWRVHSTYRYAGLANGLMKAHQNATIFETRLHDGELYLCRLGYPTVLHVDRRRWRLRPMAAAAMRLHEHKDTSPWTTVARTGSATWADVDGDGRPQAGEITTSTVGGWWPGKPLVTTDLSYWAVQQQGPSTFTVLRWPVKGWTAAGAPLYGAWPGGERLVDLPPRATKVSVAWGSNLHRDDADGSLYVAVNDRMPKWGLCEDAFLLKYDAGGRLSWTVGRKGHVPGTIDCFRRFVGIAHGCPVLTNFSNEWGDEMATRTYVWDADGLWVGGLFDRPDCGRCVESMYSFGAEALSANLRVEPATGDVLLVGCWLNEARVWRIRGWKDWVRTGGAITVDRPGAVPASPVRRGSRPPAQGAGLTGEYFTGEGFDPARRHLVRVDPRLEFTWGRINAPATAPVPVAAGAKASYSIRWRGFIEPLESGPHAFRVGKPWVAKVTIDGKDAAPPRDARNRRLFLEAGRRYPIEVTYSTAGTYHALNHGILLTWVQPGFAHPGGEGPVPTSQLHPLPVP